MQQPVHYQMPASLTIDGTEQVVADLLKAGVSQGGNLKIDINNLAVVTTAGLQLFLSLDKTTRQAGGQMKLDGISDALFDACLQAGINERLDHWI